MPKKILIATGGTGGHIYPAVAFVQKLFKSGYNCEVLFIGGSLENNKYIEPYHYQRRSVSSATIDGKSPFKIFASCLKLTKGILQSRSIIRKFKPDVAVGFGSYYSIPPMIAAKMQSVPLVLHEANSIPGKAIKLLAPFAEVIGIHFPETAKCFKTKSVEVGMPLREGYEKGSIERRKALEYYSLNPRVKTLLVFGGSQGAKVINEAFFSAMRALKDPDSLQVIHITGDSSSAEVALKVYTDLKIRALVKAFETRMDIAWQAADIAICRAGASTVAEMFEFEVPGILIPFQKAAESHQEHNASFIVGQLKASLMLRESDLNGASLYSAMFGLLENEGKKLEGMKALIADYKTKSNRQDLCSLVLERY